MASNSKIDASFLSFLIDELERRGHLEIDWRRLRESPTSFVLEEAFAEITSDKGGLDLAEFLSAKLKKHLSEVKNAIKETVHSYQVRVCPPIGRKMTWKLSAFNELREFEIDIKGPTSHQYKTIELLNDTRWFWENEFDNYLVANPHFCSDDQSLSKDVLSVWRETEKNLHSKETRLLVGDAISRIMRYRLWLDMPLIPAHFFLPEIDESKIKDVAKTLAKSRKILKCEISDLVERCSIKAEVEKFCSNNYWSRWVPSTRLQEKVTGGDMRFSDHRGEFKRKMERLNNNFWNASKMVGPNDQRFWLIHAEPMSKIDMNYGHIPFCYPIVSLIRKSKQNEDLIALTVRDIEFVER